MRNRTTIVSTALIVTMFIATPAMSQDLAFRTSAYSTFAQSSVLNYRYDTLASGIATKYYPNRGLEWALQNKRPQFLGQLAEEVLGHNHPDLHVDSNPSHKYSDVWARCTGGTGCIGGKAAYQVKVHQDGDPASYLSDFRKAGYKNNRGFIIPKEHRAAARRYARKHGRPDIAKKITDRYKLTNEELNDIADTGKSRNRGSDRWVSFGIQAAMLAYYAVQTCKDGMSPEECAENVVKIAGTMLLSNLAVRGISSFLVRNVGVNRAWAHKVGGLTVNALIEVYFAYTTYGLSGDMFIASAIGISATMVGALAGKVCTLLAPSFLGPFAFLAPLAGMACGAGAYWLVKSAGSYLWRELKDEVVTKMEERVGNTEASLRERKQRLFSGK
jgi:hypothetical protein